MVETTVREQAQSRAKNGKIVKILVQKFSYIIFEAQVRQQNIARQKLSDKFVINKTG